MAPDDPAGPAKHRASRDDDGRERAGGEEGDKPRRDRGRDDRARPVPESDDRERHGRQQHDHAKVRQERAHRHDDHGERAEHAGVRDLRRAQRARARLRNDMRTHGPHGRAHRHAHRVAISWGVVETDVTPDNCSYNGHTGGSERAENPLRTGRLPEAAAATRAGVCLAEEGRKGWRWPRRGHRRAAAGRNLEGEARVIARGNAFRDVERSEAPAGDHADLKGAASVFVGRVDPADDGSGRGVRPHREGFIATYIPGTGTGPGGPGWGAGRR